MALWDSLYSMWSGFTSKIYLVTWNVHGTKPPSDLTDLLDLNDRPLPDIYVIGLQEVGSTNWDGALLNVLKSYDFVRVKTRKLQGICTIVFVKRNHLPFVNNIESEVTKTGFKGVWGNKGAASIRMDFHGMNVIFVNCHLAPHMENLRERVVNIDSILDTQKFRDDDTDNIMDHDYVFWFGDMNFRVENTSYNQAIALVRDENYKDLLANDQLRMVIEEGLVFEGFHEGAIDFAPTYKFDAGTDSYDSSSQQRIPSYTDRILYYFHNTEYAHVKLSAKSLRYRTHQNYRISDHKPVSAVVDINVMSKGPKSPITLEIGKEPWNKFAVNRVSYTIRKGFFTSTWDWIGLYVSDFSDLSSHIKYIWASTSIPVPNLSTNSVQMIAEFTDVHLFDLPEGEYVICYLTRKGSLCGISKTFTIKALTAL